MMNPTQPFVLHAAPCQEGWGDVARGNVLWRTLFSSDITPTNALTAGVYEITSGNALEVHRHCARGIFHSGWHRFDDSRRCRACGAGR